MPPANPPRWFMYNKLKLRTLSTFENRGWLSPPAFAVIAKFYPIRSAYSYLRRLHRYQLLDRALDARGLLLYRLTDKGRRRIVWIRSALEQRERER